MNDVAAQVPHKWKDIAQQLRTTYAEVEAICPTSFGEINSHYTQIFTIWKSRKSCEYTWRYLISVLRAPAVGCNDIAENLEAILAAPGKTGWKYGKYGIATVKGAYAYKCTYS